MRGTRPIAMERREGTCTMRASACAWLCVALGLGCGGKAGSASSVPSRAGAVADASAPGASGDAASDAGVAPDAPPCTTDDVFFVSQPIAPDGGLPSEQFTLSSFHPSNGTVTILGPLDCSPYPNEPEPIVSLAVDRSGHLFVNHNFNEVLPVQTTASGFACQTPGFGEVQFGLEQGLLDPEGLAFAGTPGGGEALFGDFIEPVTFPPAGSLDAGTHPEGDVLGTLDVDSGQVTLLKGTSHVPIGSLTGTADGRLFVGWVYTVTEVSPATGATIQTYSLYSSLADAGIYGEDTNVPFVFWAGDFFVFTGYYGAGSSQIMRFHTADSSAQVIAKVPGTVTAATVSTCAPLH